MDVVVAVAPETRPATERFTRVIDTRTVRHVTSTLSSTIAPTPIPSARSSTRTTSSTPTTVPGTRNGSAQAKPRQSMSLRSATRVSAG